MNEGGNTMSVKILRIQQVAEQTGLSQSSLYKQMRMGLFPRPIKLTARASGWEESAVQAWIEKKVKESKNYVEVSQ
jgi:prophage regulatory protein